MEDWSAIERALTDFAPISLQEMKAVRLMNRMDQKYIMSHDRLAELLQRIAPDYYVQRIEDAAVARYQTLYYDTLPLEMYMMHHDQKLTRQKVRVRTYLSSPSLLTFFEIKNKNNKRKTGKLRIEVPRAHFDTALDLTAVQEFVVQHTPYRSSALVPQLENSFGRITLVDKGMHERVTIDSDVAFCNRQTGVAVSMSRLVILEVKHEAGATASNIERALSAMRIAPRRISKYCIGTVLTNAQCKYNRFKQKVRLIERLTDGQCAPQSPNRHLFG